MSEELLKEFDRAYDLAKENMDSTSCNDLTSAEIKYGDTAFTYYDFTAFQLAILAWQIEDLARTVIITHNPIIEAKKCFYDALTSGECLMNGYLLYRILTVLTEERHIGRRSLALVAFGYPHAYEIFEEVEKVEKRPEQLFVSWLYAPLHQLLSGLSLAKTDVYPHLEPVIDEFLMRGKLAEIETPALTRQRPGAQYRMSITTLGRIVTRYLRRVIKDRDEYESGTVKEISKDIRNLSKVYCAYNSTLYNISKMVKPISEIKKRINVCAEARRLAENLMFAAERIDVSDEIKRDIRAEIENIRVEARHDIRNFLVASAVPTISRELIELLTDWRYISCLY